MSLLNYLKPLVSLNLGLRAAVVPLPGQNLLTTPTTPVPTRGMANQMHWPDWRCLKDQRRRLTVIKYSAERDRLNTIKKNRVLPIEIREIAAAAIANEAKLPRDSNYVRLVSRCAITSRPKGCVSRWRLSRIMWRLIVDYNKASGIQRAMW